MDRNPTHFHSFGTWSSRSRWPLLVSPAKVFFQVSLIVMITRLVEKNKLKAHQYWPDDTDETEIGPEIEVSWPTHKFLLRLVLSGGWRSQDLPPLHLLPRFILPQVSQSCLQLCCWRWWEFWDPLLGNFPSLFPWVRLGRLYSFTRKIGQIWESLMVPGKNIRCWFRIKNLI